jgi:NTE family protein
MKKHKIGLALGSGGAKGFAHIGVLKVLREHGVPIDFIAGSSIGAFIGAYYAAHEETEYLEKMLCEMNWQTTLSFLVPAYGGGLIKGEKMGLFIKKMLKGINFESLKIPFMGVVTDFKTGEEIDYDHGDLVKVVLASMSVPFLFQPLHYDHKTLCDGGLVNPVPHDVVYRMGADTVIAVNLDNHYFDQSFGKAALPLPMIGLHAINILRYQLAKKSLGNPAFPQTIVLDPHIHEQGLIGFKKLFDVKAKLHMIEAGEKAARLVIKDILARI